MDFPTKVLILLLIIGCLLAFWFTMEASNGKWVCMDGEWIKHGFTVASKPESVCGKVISSFKECLESGYPVMESYPRQCQNIEGKLFVENIGNELEKIDLIRVEHPRPNQGVDSPLLVKGEARGTWFFEGDFPIKLLDRKGNVIGTAVAQAQDEWMTEDFVLFEAIIIFQKPTTGGIGTLILEKDNPSGLPENDDELRVPVLF